MLLFTEHPLKKDSHTPPRVSARLLWNSSPCPRDADTLSSFVNVFQLPTAKVCASKINFYVH